MPIKNDYVHLVANVLRNLKNLKVLQVWQRYWLKNLFHKYSGEVVRLAD